MAERTGRTYGAVVIAALVVGLATGCSDAPAEQDTAGDAGSGRADVPGASVPFELVATDQLTVSPDGSEVLADCWNGICRWDTATGSLELVPDRGSVAVAPDWSTVATVDGADVVLEDLDSGEPVRDLRGPTGAGVTDGSSVTAVAYSPDGSMVAAATHADEGGGEAVTVWTVGDGSEVATLETGSEVHTLAFSPDGEQIATAGNGPVEVHDIDGGDTILESADGGTVVWSPDGRMLLGPGPGSQPVVWDTRTWEKLDELAVPDLHEAAFAPDSTTVAVTTLRATTVALWDVDGEEAVHLGAHATAPGAVAWSPDGAVLYSVSAEDGVLAWDTEGDLSDVSFELPEGP